MGKENIETRKSSEVSYEKVSPTARGIAYRRAICDIPFAKDVYDELAKVMTPEEKEQIMALTFRGAGQCGLARHGVFRYEVKNRSKIIAIEWMGRGHLLKRSTTKR